MLALFFFFFNIFSGMIEPVKKGLPQALSAEGQQKQLDFGLFSGLLFCLFVFYLYFFIFI